jgi:hypothetical protein
VSYTRSVLAAASLAAATCLALLVARHVPREPRAAAHSSASTVPRSSAEAHLDVPLLEPARTEVTPESVTPSAAPRTGPTTLEPSAESRLTVRFHLLDHRDIPVPNVACSLSSDHGRTVREARSDALGEAMFVVPEAGLVRLDTPFADTQAFLLAPGASGAVELAVPFALSVSGQVRAPDGTAAPGAHVFQSLVGARSRAGRVAECDESGRFLAEPVYAGSYLFARSRGHADSVSVRLEESHAVRGVTLVLEPALEYRGQVVAPDGQPVAGADVWIGRRLDQWSNGDDGRAAGLFASAIHTLTDSEGRFCVLDGPSHTRGPVSVRARGFAGRVLDEVLPSLEPRIELAPERIVRGTVRRVGGEALRDAAVEWGAHSSFLRTTTWTDSRGAFELAGLPDLPLLELRVSCAGHRQRTVEIGRMDAFDALTIELAPR